MTLFKQQTTDIYKEDATFDYGSTLERTVDKSSQHTHSSSIGWSTDSTITCKSPKVTETYETTEQLSLLDFSAYGFRQSYAPYNISIYGYSVNVSALYANTSTIIINFGRRFLLPSPRRQNYGLWQVKFAQVKDGKNAKRWDVEEDSFKLAALYAEHIKGRKKNT